MGDGPRVAQASVSPAFLPAGATILLPPAPTNAPLPSGDGPVPAPGALLFVRPEQVGVLPAGWTPPARTRRLLLPWRPVNPVPPCRKMLAEICRLEGLDLPGGLATSLMPAPSTATTPPPPQADRRWAPAMCDRHILFRTNVVPRMPPPVPAGRLPGCAPVCGPGPARRQEHGGSGLQSGRAAEAGEPRRVHRAMRRAVPGFRCRREGARPVADRQRCLPAVGWLPPDGWRAANRAPPAIPAWPAWIPCSIGA